MTDLPPVPERRSGRERRQIEAARPRERRKGRERRGSLLQRMPVDLDRRSAEARIGLVVAGLICVGLLLDLLGGPVHPDSAGAKPGDRSVRAVYCPSAPKGGRSTATVIAGSPRGLGTSIGVEPLEAPPVEAGETIVVRSPKEPVPLDVVGYGDTVNASLALGSSSPVEGAAAALCAPAASRRWFFAEGSNTLAFDQRLLIYNPFPSEAVVRVRFYTTEGSTVKANLASVPVPSRGSLGLALNDYLPVGQSVVGTAIETIRGRVVAWRAAFAKPEDRPHGSAMTLGATQTSPEWFFPDGGVGPGFEQRLSILNPGREEAIVSIALVTEDEIVQLPKLLELRVPPRRAKAWQLGDMTNELRGQDAGPIGVQVHSVNEQPVVVEQAFFVSGGEEQGYASELGLTSSAERWWVPPATVRPSSDSLVVVNASTEDASVSVTLLGEEGAPVSPADLQDVPIPAGSRIRVPLSRFSDGKPMVALVTSGSPLLVQRTSYSAASGDLATVMGIPVP